MSTGGRPCLCDRDPERFAIMWNDLEVCVEQIMCEFAYTKPYSVYRAASRLGLPSRARGIKSGQLSPRQRAVLEKMHSRTRERRGANDRITPLQAQRIAEALARPVGPIPTLFRCRCGGRSTEVEGHASCQRRSA